MKKVIHKSSTRGYADHGWLKSYHSFSFANYYNPAKSNFGLLRVLNDDQVAGGKGFGTHPHENMEIISIPLRGDLEHKDSTGIQRVIKQNDVQVMSAGTGVFHSEYNHSTTEPVEFLQLWIFPKLKNIAPRYDQATFQPADRKNKLQQIVSPLSSSGEGLKINQDAYLSLLELEEGKDLFYEVKAPGNGVYLFLLNGGLNVEGESLDKRDAIGLWDLKGFSVAAAQKSEILFIEVPMNPA
jgi:hypothetical protein